MSLINDALKEARKASQPNQPNQPGAKSPLQPVPEPPRSSSWLLPAIVIFLLVAAIVLIGWAVNQRNHPNAGPVLATTTQTAAPATPMTPVTPAVIAPPAPPAAVTPVATPSVAPVATNPVVPPAMAAVQPPAAVPAAPTNAPSGPKLQGIFYSVSAPSAIVDGKTIHPGDTFRQYHVKAISKTAVTLIGADKQELQLTMER